MAWSKAVTFIRILPSTWLQATRHPSTAIQPKKVLVFSQPVSESGTQQFMQSYYIHSKFIKKKNKNKNHRAQARRFQHVEPNRAPRRTLCLWPRWPALWPYRVQYSNGKQSQTSARVLWRLALIVPHPPQNPRLPVYRASQDPALTGINLLLFQACLGTGLFFVYCVPVDTREQAG